LLLQSNQAARRFLAAIGNYISTLYLFWPCSHCAKSVCGGLVKAAGVGGRESKKACKSARGQAAVLSLPALSKMDEKIFTQRWVFVEDLPENAISGNFRHYLA